MRTVLITGARAPVAVDLARAFVAAGYRVHLADSAHCWAARLSNGPIAVHRLPPPRTDFQAFAARLRELVVRLDPVAIIPTCEEVFYVAAVGLGGRVLAPPLDALRMLHSKILFADHAHALGIAAPETWRIERRADLALLPAPPGDLVFKPEFSRFATHTLIRPTSAQLDSIHPTPKRPWAAQRFVAGEEACMWSFARQGAIVAAAAYRPVWRHGKAAAYAFERIDCPGAMEVARAVAAAGKLTGHLSFDLIIAPDGTAIPIECNPRAVSGLHLLDAQPALAGAILGGGEADAVAGLRYLSPAMALLGGPTAIASGRIGELLHDIRRGRDSVGRPGDRGPVIGALLDAGHFMLGGFMSRRSAAGAATGDIEWNGEPIA